MSCANSQWANEVAYYVCDPPHLVKATIKELLFMGFGIIIVIFVKHFWRALKTIANILHIKNMTKQALEEGLTKNWML